MKRKKSILLTGATGFLGSHLLHALYKCGYPITILKRRKSSLEKIHALIPKIRSYNIEAITLQDLFEEASPHTIIHTATCYGVGEEKGSDIFNSNLIFPLRLLEYGARAGIQHFINTDSALPNSISAYASSKKLFLKWGKQEAQKNNIAFSNIILEHMLGPGEGNERFPSYIITKCLKNAPKIPLTPGKQKRDFIFIDDVVEAYLTILENIPKGYEDYPLGSGNAVTIESFVKTIKTLSHASTHLDFGALPYRDGEVMTSAAKTNKLQVLGWKPKHTLEESIKKSIEYCQKEYSP